MPHVQITLLEGRTPEQKHKVRGHHAGTGGRGRRPQGSRQCRFSGCSRHRLCPRRRPGGRPETRSLAAYRPSKKHQGNLKVPRASADSE